MFSIFVSKTCIHCAQPQRRQSYSRINPNISYSSSLDRSSTTYCRHQDLLARKQAGVETTRIIRVEILGSRSSFVLNLRTLRLDLVHSFLVSMVAFDTPVFCRTSASICTFCIERGTVANTVHVRLSNVVPEAIDSTFFVSHSPRPPRLLPSLLHMFPTLLSIRHPLRSDWHLGFPDCGLTEQSPINLAADVEEVVGVSRLPIF